MAGGLPAFQPGGGDMIHIVLAQELNGNTILNLPIFRSSVP